MHDVGLRDLGVHIASMYSTEHKMGLHGRDMPNMGAYRK
jgi:hypothetical protein